MATANDTSTEHDTFTRIWDGMVALTPTTAHLMLLMDALGFHARQNGINLDHAFQAFIEGASDAEADGVVPC